MADRLLGWSSASCFLVSTFFVCRTCDLQPIDYSKGDGMYVVTLHGRLSLSWRWGDRWPCWETTCMYQRTLGTQQLRMAPRQQASETEVTNFTFKRNWILLAAWVSSEADSSPAMPQIIPYLHWHIDYKLVGPQVEDPSGPGLLTHSNWDNKCVSV